jgi:hypothetical protein
MKYRWNFSLAAKLSGVCLLFGFMAIIAACSSTSNQGAPGAPVATITVSFGQAYGSPTPGLQPYYCGGWATDATLPYTKSGVVMVYGKFTQTDPSGNPVGVGGATATATVFWPDGTVNTISATTTSDGLAVFAIPLEASAINHIVLINIQFVKGNLTCNIPQPAYFTAIIASPVPNGSATPSGGNLTPTPTPKKPHPTPTPKHGG